RYRIDEDSDFIDADRRLIYIANLDAWSILALVGTAPESLFRLLGDFMINYICASPSIGVSFSTEGLETFALQFSFPYRVWRSSAKPMSDNRKKKPSGEPLRASRNVTFLRRLAKHGETQTQTDVIHATNISCMVTGYDQSRWTGLVFSETWFDEILDDPSPDMIARYENDFLDGLVFDPLCRGKDDATKSRWSPRPYFIRVLEIRILQIHREWAFVCYNLDRHMRAITERHKEFITRVRAPTQAPRESRPSQGQILREFDEFEKGLSELKDMFEEVAQDLKETVRRGESFMKTDVLYFLNYDEPSEDASHCFPHLTQIRKTFHFLEQLQQRVGDMQQRCKGMMDDGVSARKIYRLQLPLAASPDNLHHFEPRVLAWITIMTQPLIVTAAIFGCDDIVTFKRNWQNFVIVLVVITTFLIIILAVMLRLVKRRWARRSPDSDPDDLDGGQNSTGDGVCQENEQGQGQPSVPRRPTFFTAVVDRLQSRGIRGTIAGSPSTRGQIMGLEQAVSR
ncbi:hypothetical protein CLIM01_11028, partial [Colletotrichum limetticola]